MFEFVFGLEVFTLVFGFGCPRSSLDTERLLGSFQCSLNNVFGGVQSVLPRVCVARCFIADLFGFWFAACDCVNETWMLFFLLALINPRSFMHQGDMSIGGSMMQCIVFDPVGNVAHATQGNNRHFTLSHLGCWAMDEFISCHLDLGN